jgi:hypothetical protein
MAFVHATIVTLSLHSTHICIITVFAPFPAKALFGGLLIKENLLSPTL